MKKLLSLGLSVALLAAMLLPTGLANRVAAAEPEPIVFTADMITTGNKLSDGNHAMYMFDDDLNTSWAQYPETEVIFDLGQYYYITETQILPDKYGGTDQTVTIYVGTTAEQAHMVAVNSYIRTLDDKYRIDNPNKIARYIKLGKNGYGFKVREFKATGIPLGQGFDRPALANPTATALDQSDPGVHFAWTDNGATGFPEAAADRYEVRYSTEEITEANYADATLYTGTLPTPAANGAENGVDIFLHELAPETTYYFAVRAIDELETPVASPIATASFTTLADEAAPATVSDLAVSNAGSKNVLLALTAVGDNGMKGTAASYEVRYSTEEITEENFSEATLAQDVEAPIVAGTAQTLTVKGLEPATAYYFALKAIDAAGNVSALSNVATATTKELDETPPSAIDDLAAAVNKKEITFTFTAPGNDGDEGTAALYDIRYSLNPLTAENWESAVKVPGAFVPQAAGSSESITIGNLPDGVVLYFGIKAIDGDENVSEISNIVQTGVSKMIPFEESMMIEDVGRVNDNSPLSFFDDNLNVGDPMYDENKIAPAATYWGPNWGWQGKLENILLTFTLDLGAEYDITDVYIYDQYSSGKMEVYTGEPFNWTLAAEHEQNTFLLWQPISVNKTTRYLHFEFPKNIFPYEIVIYGLQRGEKITPPERQPHEAPKLDEFIGTNSFVDISPDLVAAVGNVREYHNWSWTGQIADSEENLAAFQPAYGGGGAWFFDNYYSTLKEMGIYAFPTIQGTNKDVFGHAVAKPVLPGEDTLNPASYWIYADHLFQYAARYGSQKVDESLLKLAEGQPAVSGLGLLETLEALNEPNQTWSDRIGYHTPYEYAALASAVYDGHEGTMGEGYGIKNADPNMKLSMGGQAGIHPEHLKAMYIWSQYNRTDKVFPMDVINFHTYLSKTVQDGDKSVTYGISPEEGDLRGMLESTVDFRDRYLPDVDIWLSEFGWDTNQGSVISAKEYGDYSAWEVQAMWLTRSFLILSSMGIDKAQMYMIEDTGAEATTSGRYGTCGLLTSRNTGHQKKTSWYYLYTLKNRMEGMRFVREIETGNDNIWIYEYQDDAGKKAYAAWCPTSDGTHFDNVELSVDTGSMTLVNFEDKSTLGKESTLAASDGKVTFSVSEVPVLLIEGEPTPDTAPTWPEGSEIKMTRVDDLNTTISWPEAQDNDSVMFYVINDGETELKTLLASEREYTVTFNEAKPNYDIRIYAVDKAGLRSEALTETVVPVDIYPPTAPTEVQCLTHNDTDIMLTWQPSTDNVGVTGYNIYVNGELAETVNDLSDRPWCLLTGLIPGTEYTLTITAFDLLENESEPSEAIKVTTTGQAPDTEPPAKPEGLTAEAATTSVMLRWNATTDNVGVTGYRVYNGDTLVAETQGTWFEVTKLNANSVYHFKVSAVDAAGNESARAEVNTQTLAEPDKQAPTAPANLKLVKAGATSAHISWDASTDNSYVKGYSIYVNGQLTMITMSPEAMVLGLSPETKYEFVVTAFDAAGNESDAATLSVTTAKAGTAEPDPDDTKPDDTKPDDTKPSPSPSPATGQESALPLLATLLVPSFGILWFLIRRRKAYQ